MHSIIYRITTLSPLMFAANTGDPNMVGTKQYIPGTAIMGLFASGYINKKSLAKGAHKDAKFYKWFLRGGLIFTNALILCREDINKERKNFFIPLSIQEDKDKKNSIYDLLLYEDDSDIQTKAIMGFGRIAGEYLYTQSVKTSLNFHHERDPNTGTSREGRIFNYESIDPGQSFEGSILGDEDDLKEFLSIFPEEEQTIYLGRSRNSQYGKATLEIISREPKEYTGEIDDINSTLDESELTMTMLSDTMIYNEYGYSTTDTWTLERLLSNYLGKEVRIKKAFIKAEDVETFRSIWRLRTPSENCFAAGSCFVLTGINSSDRDKLLELQRHGIGERRGEGFGRVVFGWHENEKLTKRDSKPPTPERPSEIPEEIKGIVKKILLDMIKRIIEHKALQEANKFRNLPSKSLLGRLEAMVRSMSREDFLKILDEPEKDKEQETKKSLRKTARDKLQACNNGNHKLLEFLKEKEISLELILKEKECSDLNIKEILGELNIEPEELETEGHYKTYFTTFFAQMRKSLKNQR